MTDPKIADPTAATMIDETVLDSLLHEIDLHSDVLFTWDYTRSRPALGKLYEKAKTSQWNGSTDLDWSIEVDWDALAAESAVVNTRFNILQTADDSPLKSWGETEWNSFHREVQTYFLSQFLHGEQGALACTGLITATVPWIDAKYYAATQVMDEARHVEVFARYIEEKTSGAYPINSNLGGLLDDIITDGRWDMTYLGMQIMVEGLALAAFGMIQATSNEPLIKQIVHMIMQDEARHVAFGVLSLKGVYDDMGGSELKDREDFILESSRLMRDRFLMQEVWECMGMPVAECLEVALQSEPMKMFRQMLFSKIVPNVKRLGLLTPRVRKGFEELGVLHFETWDASA